MRRAAATAALALLTAGLYALGASVTLAWFDSPGIGPAFFPAAGVTLSALAVSRRQRWPAILAAVGATEWFIDVVSGQSAAASLGYSLANTLEPLTGALLLRAAVGRPDLGRRRDLWAFLALACLAGPAVGAAVAASTHTLTGGPRDWGVFAARWMVGDGLGVLLVGGAVLGWRSGDERTRRRLSTPAGWALLAASLVASLAVFVGNAVWLGYLLALLLVGVAFVLGTRGVGLAGFGMALVVAEASATGRIRVPAEVSPDAAWFAVNLVIGLVVVVGLALAVEIGEREESVRRRNEAEEARRSAEERAEAATERGRLLDAERRARARGELLQDLTDRLSRLTAPTEVVTAVTELTAAALSSRTAVLAVPEDGALVSLACHGYTPQDRTRLDAVLAAGASVPLVEAHRRNGFVSASGAEQVVARFAAASALPARFGAVAAVPVVVDDRPVGALGWGFDDERTFDEDFVALVTAIGAQAGLAMERGRLFEAQRAHTRRLVALQETVALMAAAPSTAAVLDAVLGHGLAAVGAASAVVRVVGPDGRFAVAAEHGLLPAPVADEAGLTLAEARTPLADAVRSGAVVTLPSLDDAVARYPGFAPALAVSGETAWAAVPFDSTAAQGGLALGFAATQPFDAEQLSLLATLGQVAGQSLGRAAAAEREHSVAVELQQSLLGRPDAIPGLEVAGVYRPGTQELQVGGDWYDVVRLPGDRVGLVVGDVAGHSLAAAVAMGQVRSTLRALATVAAEPGDLLERLDAAVEEIENAAMTSLFYAVLDPASGALSYACAGHPPPLLVPAAGEPRFLEDGLSPLLGVPSPGPRPTAHAVLDPGTTLLLYTDGLVERRGESLTKSLQSLADHARSACQDTPAAPAVVCDRLMADLLGPDAADDTALLAVRRSGIL